MAETLANGVVIPNADGGETISPTGVEELRRLGATADAAIGTRSLLGHTHSWGQITGKPTVFPPAAHEHTWAQITGKPVVFPPAAHQHSQADVVGLAAALAAKMDREAIELEAGTDANTLDDPGVYYESRSTDAGPNFPEAVAGVFTVTSNPPREHVHQSFITFGSSSPRQWYRSRYNGTWSPWKQLVTEERLAEALAGIRGLGAHELTNENLDDVRTEGVYWQSHSSEALESLNYPATRAGSLTVKRNPLGTQVNQHFVTFDATANIRYYIRNFYQTWGDWWEVPLGAQEPPDLGDKVYRGSIASGTDVSTLRTPGVYSVPTVAVANTLIGYPTKRAGTLEVWTNPDSSVTTQTVIAMVSTTAPTEVYTRATISSLNTAWSPWASPEWIKGTLLGTSTARVNVDTYRVPGAWIVSNRTYVDGLPGFGTGLLEVITSPATGFSIQRYTERVAADGTVNVWHRVSLLVGGWAGIAWDQLNKPVPPAPAPITRVSDVQVSDHATRVEYAASRRGGCIGTAGLPVFMWRFDHWLRAFRDKLLPILREYDLPATLNVNYDNIGSDQNGGGSITWLDVQDWNQYSGIEIANHGSTHTNVDTMEEIYHEIVEGRRLLEQAMPRTAVETWQEHGSAYLVATDLPGDTGLDLGRSLEAFTDSYAGRLVMAEHAVVEGKTGSFYPPLTGRPQIGQSHYSLDRDTADSAISVVQYAQTLGRGLTGYVHPGLMDQVNIGGSLYEATYNEDGSVDLAYPAGSSTHYATEAELRAAADTNGWIVHMSTGDFRQICAWLAAERDEGRLMVMTAAGGAFADRSHDRRENILVSPDFADTTAWTGLAAYTVTGTGQDVIATSTAAAGPLAQNMLLFTRFGWAMGAAHELLVHVRAELPTTLTLTVEQLGNPTNWQTTKTYEVPGGGVVHPYRLNLTLPRDRSISQMTVRLGGPSLTIVGQPLLAAI